MELSIFLQGILVGIAIAFPKGPAGLLVINQTVLFGLQKGLNTAKGPMITTFISSVIVLLMHTVGIRLDVLQQIRYNLTVHVIGGLFLIGIGLYIIFFLKEKQLTTRTLFLYTFFEPFLFPATIGTFLWICPTIFTETIPMRSIFFFGIILGTVIWYNLSCKGFDWLSKKGFIKIIGLINVILGIIFVLLGMITVLIANYKAILMFE
jgi:arginine exporter protein ArgO